jgi:hypothetical protein
MIVLFLMSLGTSVLYAEDKGANVDVILEIEGEYKFEPFKEPSPGLEGLINKGVLRVITESEQGLSKYAALNDAMQKARKKVWDAVVNNYIAEGITVKDAIMAAPPYKEYKPKDDEKEKFNAMTEAQRKAFIEKNGKEKKYDFEKYLEIIKECGSYKNSGRFYDAVEKIGYACLEVSKDEFFKAVENDKINIFKDRKAGEKYKPMDRQNLNYDAVIIDATDTDYKPQLFVRLESPTDEAVYEGIAGKKNIFFAENLDDAKSILGEMGAHRVMAAKANFTVKKVGLSMSLPDADRIFSALVKNNKMPFVIIYKTETTETTPPGE